MTPTGQRDDELLELLERTMNRVADAAPTIPLDSQGRGSRWLATAAAAALVLGGAAGLTMLNRSPDSTNVPVGAQGTPVPEPSASSDPKPVQPTAPEALVRDAAAGTSSALDGSGRVTVNDTTTKGDGPAVVQTRSLQFDGDDWELTTAVIPAPGAPSVDAATRYVGGSTFVRHVGSDGVPTWTQDPDDVGIPQPLPVITNPATLFGALDPVAHFTVAGDENVDGEKVTHLVATTPTAVAGGTLGASGVIGVPHESGATTHLTEIHVWINANGLIRQMRVTGTNSWSGVDLQGQAVTSSETFDTTVAFTDFGAHIDIETPPDVQIVDANG